MPQKAAPAGLMVLGSDTNVGKTFVTALIARQLHAQGIQVGVYKPAASGCRQVGRQMVADDAVTLWEAAGRPLTLAKVCPQRFAAPLAPHLAARVEGKELSAARLRSGMKPWLTWAEFTLVEGAGGVLSPLGENELVADLALDLDLPVILVVANRLGAVNQALQTQLAALVYGLKLRGVVLNDVAPPDATDPSRELNAAEIKRRLSVPLLAHLPWQSKTIRPRIDWRKLAARE
jgi:dethiobiotin synthetase